ncbi:MAG: S53 family peptidase [Candidatus Parvarchaeota archaeon]|nr:S53 family peptidase [Candidatus Parvarchaeota archaeon]MCL5100999.1 S53 family peptidase [Candidatus Parvarchaeota archaeon]
MFATEFKFKLLNVLMKGYATFLIFITLLLATSVSHAAINLNMNSVPFQGNGCPDLTPAQLQTAYGFTQLYSNGINGSNENIAIIVSSGDPRLISDVNTFSSAYNLPSMSLGKNIFVETPFGSPSSYSENWSAETALDVETVHSLAPSANIYVVVSPNDSFLFNVTQYAVQNLPVSTISISWGASETTYSQQEITQLDSIFYLAAQKRIGVFVASGDSGAYNSLSSLNVNYPASSPSVIAVGGTQLSVGFNGAYSGETAWDGSGGGESQFFQKPAVQPNLSSNRMIPDVSFNAGTPICAYVNSTWRGYYGTSVAAPSWAAINALVNQKTSGEGALSLNSLYRTYYADGSLGFNLISSGNNGYYYANGTYNMAVGIGSPKVYQLLQLLSANYQKIIFNSTGTNVIFNIDGINYTAPVTLNFSYGADVVLKAYALSNSKTVHYAFGHYSGYINSSNLTTVFPVLGSGYITANFKTEFRTLQYDVNGYQNTSQFLSSGSTLNVNSSLRRIYGNFSYSLVGFKFDNGPIIHKANNNFIVASPINITFIWLKSPLSKFNFLNAPSNATVAVSYIDYIPLSNMTSVYSSIVSNGEWVPVVKGSALNYSTIPDYVGGYRYIVNNSEGISSTLIQPIFIKESRYNIRFLSSSGQLIYPTRIYTRSNGIRDSFPNSTVWAPVNEDFYITGTVFQGNGFNILKEPILLHFNGTATYTIPLPIGDIAVSVSLYLGIPVISANVKFEYGNLSLSNSTSISGTTTFYDVPDTNYNLTVNAYGATYDYGALAGTQQTLEVTPLLYQTYLMGLLVGVILLAFVLYEIRIRKSHRPV